MQKLGQFVGNVGRGCWLGVPLLVPAPPLTTSLLPRPSPLVYYVCVCGAQKLGQFVAVAVGLVFLLVQGLAYTGFITVQWTKVHGVVLDVLDVNKDGWVRAVLGRERAATRVHVVKCTCEPTKQGAQDVLGVRKHGWAVGATTAFAFVYARVWRHALLLYS